MIYAILIAQVAKLPMIIVTHVILVLVGMIIHVTCLVSLASSFKISLLLLTVLLAEYSAIHAQLTMYALPVR